MIMEKLLKLEADISKFVVKELRHLYEFKPVLITVKIADQSFYPVLLLFSYLLFLPDITDFILLTIMIILGTLLSMPMKRGFNRKRPPWHVNNANNYFDQFSFPSGHSMRIGILFTFFILCYTTSLFSLTVFGLWSVLAIIWRVASSSHYLFDVLFGYILGMVVVFLTFYLISLSHIN